VNGEFTIHCLTPNGQRLRLHERIAGKRSGSLARAVDFFRVLPHQRQREIRDHLPRGAPTNFRHLRKLPRGLVTLPESQAALRRKPERPRAHVAGRHTVQDVLVTP
jgi:hypothetical protein